MTKLVGGSNAGSSRVPLPVNTASLRKENGGQDITAVIVNRNGGELQKLGVFEKFEFWEVRLWDKWCWGRVQRILY